MKREDLTGENTGRVVALLTRDEIDFIDGLSKDALFSTGRKLSRTEVIRAIIDAVKIRDISGKGIHSKAELEKRLLYIMRITLPASLHGRKRHEGSR